MIHPMRRGLQVWVQVLDQFLGSPSSEGLGGWEGL
jgi:hypothetical protein